MPGLPRRQRGVPGRPAPSLRLPPGQLPAVRLGWGAGRERELPSFTEASPQPPEGIEEGGSGEGKRLDTERKGRHRVHPSAQSVQTRIFTDIYRYIQRGSISIPLRPFFSFGNRSPSVRHLLPTTPRTPIHPSLHPYTPAGGQALLRGDGRGSGGHHCTGTAPGAQDPARLARRSRRSRRAGQDRAGQG